MEVFDPESNCNNACLNEIDQKTLFMKFPIFRILIKIRSDNFFYNSQYLTCISAAHTLSSTKTSLP